MLSHEAAAQLAAQRQAFRQYMAGPRDGPLTLEKNEAYCVDSVLRPSLLDGMRLSLRYVLLRLAFHAPFCALKIGLYRLLGMKIGRDVCISPEVVMDPLFPELIELEDDCCLGIGCRLFTHEYTAANFRVGPIRVGKGSVVGSYATVRSGTTIGARVTVGACSFVNRDVPDDAMVGGVPAKPLISRGKGN